MGCSDGAIVHGVHYDGADIGGTVVVITGWAGFRNVYNYPLGKVSTFPSKYRGEGGGGG